MTYNPEAGSKRKISKNNRVKLWFNPPYCASVKTNLGKEFLNLMDKHFDKNHELHRIINRNKVKISYSCNANLKRVIQLHNNKVLNNKERSEDRERECNCRIKENCPLQGRCLSSGIVYEAEVVSKDIPNKYYIGQTAQEFKSRLAVHKNSFKNRNSSNPTELTKYIWSLIDSNKSWNIKWRIIGYAKPYSQGDRFCALCNLEKTKILFFKVRRNLLNGINIIEKCRQKNLKCLVAWKGWMIIVLLVSIRIRKWLINMH